MASIYFSQLLTLTHKEISLSKDKIK